MSRKGQSHLTISISFPRVSGDEPGLLVAANPASAFSPRERG